MNNTIEYKGYIGSVEFSQEDKLFYGKVQGIRALISYEGATGDELLEDFYAAVDSYIELCKSKNQAPEQAYKGSFNVRISPDLHKKSAVYAISHQQSLNSFVEHCIKTVLGMQHV